MRRLVIERGWPGERQRLLLAAASWEGDRAQRAWERWREGFDPDRLTLQDMRLLPAVYRPMRARGLDDPALALARTLYRRAWFINQLALRRAAGAVTRLRDAGIEVLVLKGVALAVLHYDDLGARPMQDVDLLVDPARAADAVGALASTW